MSEPEVQTHPVYSHQTDDERNTVVAVDWMYLTGFTHRGRTLHDPGGVRLTLSDAAGDAMCATVDPEVAIEIADGIRDAANLALAARESGVVPDGVPAEWTGEGGAQ